MLLDLLKSLLRRDSGGQRPSDASRSIDECLVTAQALLGEGRVEDALGRYERALTIDPHHVVALNQAALCLTKLQRDDEAVAYFQRAALIDDSFAPGLVNLAIQLKDQHRSAQAERYLQMARKVAPDSAYIDGVLGAVRMLRGRPHEASELQLSAWLKSFDEKDFAHNYLFSCCYPSDVSAERITAEHLFWAETCPPPDQAVLAVTTAPFVRAPLDGRRVRIGYISGDFRQHSVRYFFRPLLEHHDRGRFEVFVYHDMAFEDAQTKAIEAKCDRFRCIANQPDADVARLLREDQLDILVELAGHTSITRIHLFRERLAPIQITALGYPPTTGIRQIDYKVVDPQTAPVGAEHYYAERLMRLPTSFWCFNPLEDTPEVAPAPAERNGYVTFGCFGNIAKISQRVLELWSRIMREVPNSRLVLKAITFQDDEAKQSIRAWLKSAGIDQDRVELVPPDKPELLFGAYAAIDIVLDTYPFNGGTTSCFTLWMGVPIVTLRGESLVSRMGASMLHTLGLPELVADDDDGYVRAAVALAADLPKLASIRREIRPRMLATPLGNGEMYARDFECACEAALNAEAGMAASPPPQLLVLAESELLRRAEFVQHTGQLPAAMRIADYCLQHYPESIAARIIKGSLLEAMGKLQDAFSLLEAAADVATTSEERRGIEINLARVELLLGEHVAAQQRCERLIREPLDGVGRLHVEVYDAAAHAWDGRLPPSSGQSPSSIDRELPPISWIVHCDDDGRYAAWQQSLAAALGTTPPDLHRVAGDGRMELSLKAAGRLAGDWIVFMRSAGRILSTRFIDELLLAFEQFDIVSAAGAERVGGVRWFDAGFPAAHGALVLPNRGPVGGLTLSVYGPTHRRFHPHLRILDASLFAVRRSALSRVPFDLELDGEHDLCECDWFIRSSDAGLRLGAAPLLGVANFDANYRAGANWHDCAERFRDKHGLGDDGDAAVIAGASILLPSPDHAMPVLTRFYAV